MEARARRNNIIFRGISENRGENCYQLVRDFLKNHLDIDSDRMYIARAHRLGRMQRNNQYQSRPIIVNFRDYCDIESIMGSARMLRGKPFSIDHDFPKEIQEARSRLWPMFKQIRRDAPDARVVLAYPAKIIKNGQIVRDELPNWQKYISANRISQSENTYRANATNGHGGSPRYVTSTPANSVTHRGAVPSYSNVTVSHAASARGSPGPRITDHECARSQPQVAYDVALRAVDHALPDIEGMDLSQPFPLSQTITSGQQPPDSHSCTSGQQHPGNQTIPNISQVDVESLLHDGTVQRKPVSNVRYPLHAEPLALNQRNTLTQPNNHANTNHIIDTQSHTLPTSSTCINPPNSTGNSTNNTQTPVPRGRPRQSRAVVRSEKRSESARPYRRNASTSRSKQRDGPDTV